MMIALVIWSFPVAPHTTSQTGRDKEREREEISGNLRTMILKGWFIHLWISTDVWISWCIFLFVLFLPFNSIHSLLYCFRGALFKVRPELVQMGKDNVLCFTISQRVRRKEHFLSCKPDGKLAFVHHRGSASKSELFLVFDSWRETNKDGETEKLALQTYSPASLEQLASRTLALACGGGMEGLLCNRTKEWQRQSELQFRGLFGRYKYWSFL